MLPRLAPLALVMVAACQPDYSDCRLVGVWERRVVLPEEWIVESRPQDDPTTDVAPKRVSATLVATEQFLATGERVLWDQEHKLWQTGNTKFGLGIRDDCVAFPQVPIVETRSTWRLVAEGGDRIEIEIRDHNAVNGIVRREFAVVNADHLTYRDGQIDYTMVRVKDAK